MSASGFLPFLALSCEHLPALTAVVTSAHLGDFAMTIIHFAPSQSFVQPAFGHVLTEVKVDILRLCPTTRSRCATMYTAGCMARDWETDKEVVLGVMQTLPVRASVISPDSAHIITQDPPERVTVTAVS